MTVDRLTTEDQFLAIIIVASITGSVILFATFSYVPPAILSVLFAIGISALVYRFLGGIFRDTTIAIGSFKAGGSLAALVGVLVLLNYQLDSQMQKQERAVHQLTDHTWYWLYPRKGWKGSFTFDRISDSDAKFRFNGRVLDLDEKGSKRYKVYDVVEDKSVATVKNGKLHIDALVEDRHGRKLRWTSVGGFRERPVLVNTLRVKDTSDGVPDYTTSIFFMK